MIRRLAILLSQTSTTPSRNFNPAVVVPLLNALSSVFYLKQSSVWAECGNSMVVSSSARLQSVHLWWGVRSGSYQPWRDATHVKVAVLSSGGKDSSAAIWWAQCKGWEVSHLVTMIVEGEDSWMFQIPGTQLVPASSRTLWMRMVAGSNSG